MMFTVDLYGNRGLDSRITKGVASGQQNMTLIFSASPFTNYKIPITTLAKSPFWLTSFQVAY